MFYGFNSSILLLSELIIITKIIESIIYLEVLLNLGEVL